MKVIVNLRLPSVSEATGSLGERLLEESMAVVWTGHSERATLPSLAAAVGMTIPERGYLGRWSPQGSEEYVRTYRTVIRKTIGKLTAAFMSEDPCKWLDEGEAFEAARAGMSRMGLGRNRGRGAARDGQDQVEGIPGTPD